MTGEFDGVTGGAPLVLGLIILMVVAAGSTAAVSLRDARAAVLGLLVALLAAPFLVDPLPDLRGVTARVAGGLLAAYPLIVGTRIQPATSGSRGGWPADAMIALTAAVTVVVAAAAWAASIGATSEAAGLGFPGGGLAAGGIHLPAVAGGAALLVMSASPIAFAQDPLRVAMGLILAVLGVSLLLAGLVGPPSPLVDFGITLLLVALGGGGWALVVAGARDRPVAAGNSRPAPSAAGSRDLAAGVRTNHRTAQPAAAPAAGEAEEPEPPGDRAPRVGKPRP